MDKKELMDVVLKEYTQFSSEQYAKTLFCKEGRQIEKLRKLFNIPAAEKSLVEMDIKDAEFLKSQLDNYIDNYEENTTPLLSKKYAQNIRSHVKCWIKFYHENNPSQLNLESILEIFKISCCVAYSSPGKLYKIRGVVKEIVYDAGQSGTPKRFIFVPEQNFSLPEDESGNQLAVFMEHGQEQNLKQKDARILSYRKQLEFQLEPGANLPKLTNGKTTVFLQKKDDANCEIKSDLEDTPEFDDLSIVEYGARL